MIVRDTINHMVEKKWVDFDYWSIHYSIYGNRHRLARKALNGLRKRFPDKEFRIREVHIVERILE